MPEQVQLSLPDARELIDETVRGDEWATPPKLFETVDGWHGFGLDAAAAKWSAKCERYITRGEDAFTVKDWGKLSKGRPIWLNPPYGRGELMRWCSKVADQSLHFKRTVVMLVPARTCEGWWTAWVLPCRAAGTVLGIYGHPTPLGWETVYCYETVTISVLFIKGRLKHVHESGMTESARFPSALLTYAPARHRWDGSSWCLCGHEHARRNDNGLPVTDCQWVFCTCPHFRERPCPVYPEGDELRRKLEADLAAWHAGRGKRERKR
jgi:hypothetical protein